MLCREGLFSIGWLLLIGASSVFSFKQSITTQNIKLPIFPLRKVAKLPSEQLTLNLYEERYLVMADYILSQSLQPPVFGALYSSDKPQFVKQGKGPIVPMVREGDIGVIFAVEDSEMGLIPTIGGTNRQRTRLVATGVARFEITRVLENGFGGAEDALPFILVESRLVLDDKDGGDDEELSSQVRERILRRLSQSSENVSMEEEAAPTRPQRYLELISSLSSIFLANKKNDEREILCRALETDLLVFAAIARTLPENATAKRLEALCSRRREAKDLFSCK